MNDITRMFDELICSVNPDLTLKIHPKVINSGHYKCLSVRQPWADLIVKGVKTIENRNWQTPHRGLLLIQAPLKFNHDDWFKLCDNGVFDELMLPSEYTLGSIVGAVNLNGCQLSEYCKSLGYEDSKWVDKTSKFWWTISDAIKFGTPIKWKGQLSVFDVHDGKNEIANELAGWRNQVSQ